MRSNKILKQFFGYQEFRGQQKAAIDHVLEKNHALIIMPTGMGKSLCYQIPALQLDGLTIVISPLIALMKDQVDVLQKRGIDATFINSSLNRNERETRYRAIAEGRYKLLYVTPERFRKTEFLEKLENREVDLLAVDEAHCISEWGHDFRPDYTRLDEFRKLINCPTTIALTATATPDVQVDIVRQLGLRKDDVKLFHEGIDRPNLHLEVEDAWGVQEKLDHIFRMFRNVPGNGIVYFALIKTLGAFSEHLSQKKIPHLCYHGDLYTAVRKRIQNQFMQGESKLVLATNAFGMGIDKENIRFVIHAEIPGSLESYYQEIGRAGRDSKDSFCSLLYDEQDLLIQMDFIKWNNPGAAFYQRVYDFLIEDIEQINALGLDWLKEKLLFKSWHDFRLETALGMLDRYGAVDGSLEGKDLRVTAEMPQQLIDQDYLDDKLKREQKKLYTMVEYTKTPDDRKAFIHKYFGLPLN